MKKLLGLLLVAGAALSLVAFRKPVEPPREDWVTEPVEVGPIAETVSASGTLQPRDAVAVGGDAAGRVTRVFVELGQAVKVNDALAQLDDRLAQLRLQQSKLAVELAQTDVPRVQAARDSAMLALQRARETHVQMNAPAARDAEAAELQLRAAEAALKTATVRVREAQAAQQLAEHAVEMTVVRSPIAGVVLDKRAAAGQHVGPPLSAHLFTVAPDPERMQVTAGVAEADVGKLRVGQAAEFTINAWPGEVFAGKVTRVAAVPALTPGAVQYPVTADVTNVRDPAAREWKLRAGMPAAVDFVVRRRERAWKLPAAAAAVQVDESKLTTAAQQKLARWKSRGDRADWQRVWTTAADRSLWPVFLRVGGRDAAGESGIADGQFLEILAWDPEETAPGPTPPRVLTATPEALKPAKPGLKLF